MWQLAGKPLLDYASQTFRVLTSLCMTSPERACLTLRSVSGLAASCATVLAASLLLVGVLVSSTRLISAGRAALAMPSLHSAVTAR